MSYLADLNPSGYAKTIRAMLQRTFHGRAVPTLTMPMLVLVGEENPALEAAWVTHRKIAGSQFVILPDW